ncbi:MAG: iron-containing alcohol dehydrogenase, partial [Clostridia bacterium]|nr:iron-containing alcohol dehydrogenase [Clostridia bacterium]
MRNFEYNCPTKIIFGKNAESELLYELRKYGDRVLLVYGGQSIKRSGLFESVTMQLREANKAVFELSGVLPNPRLSLVQKGIEIVKKNGVDLILAVGGGSVIDT